MSKEIGSVSPHASVSGAEPLSPALTREKLADLMAERALLMQAQATLKAVIESSSDPISAFDTEGRLIAFNQAFAAIIDSAYGIRIEEGLVVHKTLPEREALFFSDLQSRVLAGESMVLERRMEHGPAGPTYVDFRAQPLIQDGKIFGGSIFARDVTQQRRNERELQLLFTESPLPMWVFDTETLKFIRVNKAACEHYGYSESEFLSLTALDIRPKEDLPRLVEEVLPRIRSGEDAISGMSRHLKRDGELIQVHVHSNLIELDGRPMRLVLIEDITERLAAESAVVAANERFQLATHAVTSVIYELDLRSGVSQRSSGLATLTGFTLEEIPDNVNWWYSRVHPNDIHRLITTIDRCIQSDSDVYECEYRMRHKAGHYITVWDRGIVARDPEGKAIKIVGSAQDITRRRKVERELERANERFRLAAEAVNAMIYDWDLKTGYCYYSSGLEQLLGYSEGVDEEIHVEGWYLSRVHPNDRAALESVFESVAIEGHQYELEYRLRHRDGQYLYVWDRGIVLRDDSGRAVRVVGSTQNITAKKLVEAELTEQRNRAVTAKENSDETTRLKSNFLANMSHEIRTPMTAVLGFSEVLRESLKDTQEAHYAEIIESNSKRLLETIDNILDLARLESTRISVKPSMVDVTAEVERIVKLLEPLASKRNIDLRFLPTARTLTAFLDLQYLDQIITNLVSNAIKFTEKGSVRVIVQSPTELDAPLTELPGYYQFSSGPVPTSEHFRILVEDTGVGIPRENIGLIFDEFRQVSKGYGRTFEGSGIGLTISSKVANAMGGAIEVRSAKGVGSQFIVRLPMNLPKNVSSEETPLSEVRTNANRRPTILLVEDISTMAELTQAMIGQRATVLHAASTQEARRILEHVTPELILMDINLGEDLTGLDFTKELRAKGLVNSTRIVALTAYALPKDRQNAIDAGCDDYVAKPFTKAVLLEMIDRNLALRAKQIAGSPTS